MCQSAVNLSFFLSFATFRMRSSACGTLIRAAPGTYFAGPHFPSSPPLAPPAPLQFAAPQIAPRTLARFVRRFHSYYDEVRLLVPCIIGSAPRLPDGTTVRSTPHSTRRPDTRPLSFRCDPFARDVAFDPAGRQHLAVAVPHMSPSSDKTLGPCDI